MVQISLSKDVYFPGDEIKLTVQPCSYDTTQLISIRCYGYVRLPLSVIKDIPNKEQYAFRDRPIGPVIPDGSLLLWWSPNFPVHVDSKSREHTLVKLFVPYFLPPTLRGGLFEVSHWLEITVLGQMLTKRFPLFIASSNMPIMLFPAVGDGFEQFDYTKCPVSQSNTAHGRRCQTWNVVSQTIHDHDDIHPQTFRISFNSLLATELSVNGKWASEGRLVVITGNTVPFTFRFDAIPAVSVKQISAAIIRLEWILGETEQRETTVWESDLSVIRARVVETSLNVHFPVSLSPSFETSLCGVCYRLLFTFRAQEQDWLEPVLWSLPLLVKSDTSIPSYLNTSDGQKNDASEIKQVLANNSRFTLFAPN